MTAQRAGESKSTKKSTKSEQTTPPRRPGSANEAAGVAGLQQSLGNRAVQRLLTQRAGAAEPEQQGRQVSENVQTQIDEKRGGGHTLDEKTQHHMSHTLGDDFSDVQIHTDTESHELNEQLQARAFTTGNDVFFRRGEYNPQTTEGQELIAHELTHVVQQRAGEVELDGEGMQVNDPDDAYEQEADGVAEKAAATRTSSEAEPGNVTGRMEKSVQRQDAMEEEILEKPIQRQEEVEEDILQKPVQRKTETDKSAGIG